MVHNPESKERRITIMHLVLLLELRRNGPTHGSDLVTRMNSGPISRWWRMYKGTVYPMLEYLHDEGFLSSDPPLPSLAEREKRREPRSRKRAVQRRPKRTFALTQKGNREAGLGCAVFRDLIR